MSGVILLALAPIFFVLLLGYGAGRWHVVENHQVSSLNSLVMTFALPASLFVATASAPRSEMIAQAPLFGILAIVMLIVQFAWYFVIRSVSNASKADASLQALTISFPNLAGVGLPIASAVIGPSGLVPVALALAAGSIIVSPLSLIVVELNTRGIDNAASVSTTMRVLVALWRALTKPVVVAPMFGILYSFSGLEFPAVFKASLLLIGVAAPGVALFLTGLILSSQPFRLDWQVAGATGLADIVRPLLTAGFVLALPFPSEIAKIAILIAAVPSGFFGILFAVNYKLDSAAASSIVLASTVFSIVTLAIGIVVLFPQ